MVNRLIAQTPAAREFRISDMSRVSLIREIRRNPPSWTDWISFPVRGLRESNYFDS
jgi:hypothetical protein